MPCGFGVLQVFLCLSYGRTFDTMKMPWKEGHPAQIGDLRSIHTTVLLEVGTVHCFLLATPPLTSTTLQYLPLLNIHNAMRDKEVIKLEIWLNLK